MVIDVHCHVGFSARKVDTGIPRFSFEPDGARGTPGYDSYLSPRLLRRPTWYFLRRCLGIDPRLPRGDALDAQIEAANQRHWSWMPSVDRLVLLAFDEYHDDSGRVIGSAAIGAKRGSDLFASNSFVQSLCLKNPDRYLFSGSIHPYRHHDGMSACVMLEELAAAGAVLIKWLPIHQNIRADDPRTIDFLRTAARLHIPLLIHYGGEMSLSRQHMEFEHPGAMLDVLLRLRREGAMPTVIMAHMATPSFPWQNCSGFDLLANALLSEFRDAPLYADISALAAFGRTPWLRRIADRPELHSKLIWGSDYPIPVWKWPFCLRMDRPTRRRIAGIPSWIEQDLQLKRALGLADCVFHQAADLLNIR